MLMLTYLGSLLLSDVAPPSTPVVGAQVAAVISQFRQPFPDMLEYLARLPGIPVQSSRIPHRVVDRANECLVQVLIPALRPPTAMSWTGNRNSPSFDHEYLRASWVTGGRHLLWSDSDPESGLLAEVLPDEIDVSSEQDFKPSLTTWIQTHLRIPTLPHPYSVYIWAHASIPGGDEVYAGFMTLQQDGVASTPIFPEQSRWAEGFAFWGSKHLLYLQFGFSTSERKQGLPSPSGHLKQPRTKSRFDPEGG